VSRVALVTGATGGLGRTLVPALWSAGWDVRATGRRPRAGEAVRRVDLTGPLPADLCNGVDTVFHLAALSSPWGRPRDFAAINVEATGRLLAAARGAQVRRFVHVSTPSIYVEARDRLGIREGDPPATRFASAYAATKWQGEELVRGSGLAATIVRPHAIVGPDDAVLLPRLMRAVRRGRVPLPGGGRASVELTDVRDVADALIAAADRPPTEVNISGGAARPVRAIVTRVADLLGYRARIVALPPRAALSGAALLETVGRLSGREPLITRYGVKALGWSRTFDLSHARAALGWTPRITPEDAIDHALAGQCAR
jgi:nucleoside-diphosphate-sugar epimerase